MPRISRLGSISLPSRPSQGQRFIVTLIEYIIRHDPELNSDTISISWPEFMDILSSSPYLSKRSTQDMKYIVLTAVTQGHVKIMNSSVIQESNIQITGEFLTELQRVATRAASFGPSVSTNTRYKACCGLAKRHFGGLPAITKDALFLSSLEHFVESAKDEGRQRCDIQVQATIMEENTSIEIQTNGDDNLFASPVRRMGSVQDAYPTPASAPRRQPTLQDLANDKSSPPSSPTLPLRKKVSESTTVQQDTGTVTPGSASTLRLQAPDWRGRIRENCRKMVKLSDEIDKDIENITDVQYSALGIVTTFIRSYVRQFL